MRSINGNPIGSHKEQRKINGNRKVKIHIKTKLLEKQQCRKRQIQSRPRDLFSHGVAEEEEYNVDDEQVLYSDMDEIAAKSPEPEHRTLKSLASTVRPLLQLLQEDSYPIENPAPQTVKKPITASTSGCHKKQVVYKDISLSSEEEEFQQDKNTFNDNVDVGHPRQPKSKHVCRFSWTPKSTNFFLDLWEKNLKNLRGMRKNSHIHREMSEEMSEYGPSAREIKNKIDNMSRKYRLEEEKIKTGTPTNWRYFNRLKSLLTKPPSAHFEEILFDNTESSSFFQTDNSDSDSKSKDTPCVESILHASDNIKSGRGEDTEESEQTVPLSRQSSHEKEHIDELKLIQNRTDRMLQIEEEKLEIERQKLLVMKHISRDLSMISKTLIEVLQNSRK